jgi:hypothetical protein
MTEPHAEQRRPTRPDAPNQMNVRPDGSGPGTPPEGTGGSTPSAPAPQAAATEPKLPGQHAGLDELAVARGHTWSRDDLTVAEKQAELGG